MPTFLIKVYKPKQTEESTYALWAEQLQCASWQEVKALDATPIQFPEYYYPWPGTMLGVDTASVATIKKLGAQAECEIVALFDLASEHIQGLEVGSDRDRDRDRDGDGAL